MYALPRNIIAAGCLFILLFASSLCAQDIRLGYGDFCVHLNGGEDVAYIGGMNTLEIHIANDAVLLGMSPAIEIIFEGAFSWNMSYGSHPPVNEEGRAIGAWDNLSGLQTAHDFDDVSPEHIGIGGAAQPGGGLPEGLSDICYTLQFYIPDGQPPYTDGISIQPYFYQPGLTWTFMDDGGTYPPDFCDQPVASQSDPIADPVYFDIVENMPPEITNEPGGPLMSSYCFQMSYDFDASDPEGDPYWFELVSGPGDVDSATGVWTYMPDMADIGMAITGEIRACDSHGCGSTWAWDIIVTNEPPVFGSGCNETLYGQPGQVIYHQLTASDPDYCTPLVFTLESAVPPPLGPATMSVMGEFHFQPEPADTGLFIFVVRVYEEVGEYDECSFEVMVRSRGVVINEVQPWADIPDEGDTVAHTVELYNAGTSAQDLTGWTIAGDSPTEVISLPSWTMPPETYLILDFGVGLDEPDFSDDSVATYYAHDLSWALENEADEVGLYTGSPGSQTIVDFVGWGWGGSTFGDAYSYARQINMWPADGFVELDGESLLGTVGRIPSGYDTDIPDDWRAIETPRVTPMSPDNPIQLMPRDGSINLPSVDLVWRAVHGASDYLLEIYFDSTFSSPFFIDTLSDTTYSGGYSVGWNYWRVSPDLPGDPYPAAEWSFAVDTGSTPEENELLVPQKLQHKDSKLLCIWNYRKRVRPGCSEDPGKNGPWDEEHDDNLAHISGCKHCSVYCTRAAIQMVNAFFGGSLTQDEISYNMYRIKAFVPEGDLGHFQGTQRAEEWRTYMWAMGTAVNLEARPYRWVIPWGVLKNEIDNGRPILAMIRAGLGLHSVVFCGYKESSIFKVKIMDPWPGFTGWWQYSRIKVVRYYVLRPPIIALNGDPNVSLDPDIDGIMSFDEGEVIAGGGQLPRNFDCFADTKDSDDDQVPDKCEIRNYTFHNQPDYHPGCPNSDLSLSIANIDNDWRRAEGDCDSDNDGLFDGGEDVVGDGYITHSLGDTCPFDSSDYSLAISVDKDIYAFGEPVHFAEARTFHWFSVYNIEVRPGLPIKLVFDDIAWDDAILTNVDGDASGAYVTTCYEFGPHYVYVDVLSDGLYSEPDNWDPYCLWICDSIPYDGWHPIENYERFIEEFEWPFEFPTVCPSDGEVIDVDILCPWWWYSTWPQPSRDYWLGVSVPADLYFEESIWIDQPPEFVDQMDECSGTEIIPFASDAMIELDLNEQFGNEDTYWLGFQILNWQLPDSLMVTDVVLTMLPGAARGNDIPIQIRMGDSDYGWSPAYYRSIPIPYGPQYICGDADASGDVDIDDVVYLINYIFSGGPAPDPYESGDADCSGFVDIDDVVYLIAYIFSGGNAPCAECR